MRTYRESPFSGIWQWLRQIHCIIYMRMCRESPFSGIWQWLRLIHCIIYMKMYRCAIFPPKKVNVRHIKYFNKLCLSTYISEARYVLRIRLLKKYFPDCPLLVFISATLFCTHFQQTTNATAHHDIKRIEHDMTDKVRYCLRTWNNKNRSYVFLQHCTLNSSGCKQKCHRNQLFLYQGGVQS